jgi:hypothetical protein
MQCALALDPTVLQHAEDTRTLAAAATGERSIGNRLEVSHRQASHRNRPRVEKVGSTPVCRTTVPLQAGGRFLRR